MLSAYGKVATSPVINQLATSVLMKTAQTLGRAAAGSRGLGWSVPDFVDTGLGCQVGEFSVS